MLLQLCDKYDAVMWCHFHNENPLTTDPHQSHHSAQSYIWWMSYLFAILKVHWELMSLLSVQEYNVLEWSIESNPTGNYLQMRLHVKKSDSGSLVQLFGFHFTISRYQTWNEGVKITPQKLLMEFFLNGTTLSLNSVNLGNSGNLINDWSMVWDQFEDPLC